MKEKMSLNRKATMCSLRGVSYASLPEKRRFILLNRAIAVMFAIMVALISANTALAWLLDSDELISDISLAPFEKRAYAAVVKSPANSELTMVFGRGESPFSDDEVEEVFYDFLDGVEGDALWSAYLESVVDVVFKDEISPKSTKGWFAGASRLERIERIENLNMKNTLSAQAMFKDCSSVTSLDLSAVQASNLCDIGFMFQGCSSLKSLDLSGVGSEAISGTSPQIESTTYKIFDGCVSLEEIVIPSSFAFTATDDIYALQKPDADRVADADGFWYADESSLPMSPEDASKYVNSRFKTGYPASTLRAYGSPYAANYGNTILVLGRGEPQESYKGAALVKTYRGMESSSQDFSTESTSPFAACVYSLKSVESIAVHKIKPLTLSNWFNGFTSLETLDFSSIDMSVCTSLYRTFFNCQKLVDVDVSNWDVSNVETMESAFFNCISLPEIDVSRWNVCSLGKRPMSTFGIFANCSLLETIDTSKWEVEFSPAFAEGVGWRSDTMFSGCKKLKSIDISCFRLPASYSLSNWADFDFGGCECLEKITLPSSFFFRNNCIPNPVGNRGGVLNSYYWYEDGKGAALSGDEVCQVFREAYSTDRDLIETRTFLTEKSFTDEDTYAAYYVDGSTARNILVFDRGASVPKTFEGAALSTVYREIETRCGGDGITAVPWNTIRDYVKDVRINTSLQPLHFGHWFNSYYKMESISGLDRMDMSKCTSLTNAFRNCVLIDEFVLPGWDLSACENLASMFELCKELNRVDVSGWKISNSLQEQAFNYLFQDCSELREIDLSSWTLHQSFDSASRFKFYGTFDDCSSLRKISFPHLAQDANPVEGSVAFNAYASGTFKNCGNLEELIVPNDFNFSSAIIPNGKTLVGNVHNAGLWYEDKQGKAHTNEQLWESLEKRFRSGEGETYWYVDKNFTETDSYAAFYGDIAIFDRGSAVPERYEGKTLDVVYREPERDGFEVPWTGNQVVVEARFNAELSPKTLQRWFYRFVSLESVVGLENLKTGQAISFEAMFDFCSSLESLDVSAFDVTSAKDFSFMFGSCTNLTDLSLFSMDAQLDYALDRVFRNCSNLASLDLSEWSMPRWTRASSTERIFEGCAKLEEIKVSSTFNFSTTADNVYSYGVAFPDDTEDGSGYFRAACWYENGLGRPYAFYDASKVINEQYGTKGEPTVWTRYPIEDAYAAIYKSKTSGDLSLVFARGRLDQAADRYLGHELLGIGLGFEYYSWREMEHSSDVLPPWTEAFSVSAVKEVFTQDGVKTQSMSSWFEGFTNCERFDLADLDTSQCSDLWKVFADCRSVKELDLSAWDTSRVARYGGGGYNSPFYNCLNLKKASLANWNLSSLTTKNELFSVCPALEEIDMSGCVYENAPTLMSQCFKLNKVTISPEMSFAGEFFTASSDEVEGFDGRWYLESDLSRGLSTAEAKSYINDRYRIASEAVTFIAGYGDNAYAAVYKNPNATEYKLAFGRGFADSYLDGWGQEAIYRDLESNVYNSLGGAPQNSSVPWSDYRVNIAEVVNKVPIDNPVRPKSLNSWFYEMSHISSIDMSMFDVTSANDIANMLYGCTSLGNITGLEGWNVSNIETMSSAFAGVICDFGSSIKSWDTSSLKDMSWMFWNCSGLTALDLSAWNATALKGNANAFYQCVSLKSLVMPRNFVKESMSDIGQMFLECRSLVEIDVSDWDISGLKSLKSMFHNCSLLQFVSGLDRWDTSSVLDMSRVFYGCTSISVDCSLWDVSNVVDHEFFAFDAFNVIEPAWSDLPGDEVSEVLQDKSGNDIKNRSGAALEINEQGEEVLRSADRELVLDGDAKSISQSVVNKAIADKGRVKQLVFMVNLKSGERCEDSYYR